MFGFDYKVGEVATDRVNNHPCQHTTGTVSAGNFTPDCQLCHFVHNGIAFHLGGANIPSEGSSTFPDDAQA
jgi:hypothetical protein